MAILEGLRLMGTHSCFSTISAKGNNFCGFLFAFFGECLKVGSTLEAMNKLPGEKILSFTG